MSRIIGIIPARMGSSRFPGKPLARLNDCPMIEHVYRQTANCRLLDDVAIATCDKEIAEAAAGFGANVIMTSSSHVRASDRVAEAVGDDPAEIVVMVQGDEPMIQPEMISAVVAPMLNDGMLGCVNLATIIQSEAELKDPNTIKIVMDCSGNAIYLSREPIPTTYLNPFKKGKWFKQVCIIPFRRDMLLRLATLPQGNLEMLESIDMLRLLENGLPLKVVTTDVYTHAVDTIEDLNLVESILKNRAQSDLKG